MQRTLYLFYTTGNEILPAAIDLYVYPKHIQQISVKVFIHMPELHQPLCMTQQQFRFLITPLSLLEPGQDHTDNQYTQITLTFCTVKNIRPMPHQPIPVKMAPALNHTERVQATGNQTLQRACPGLSPGQGFPGQLERQLSLMEIAL